MRSLCPVAAAAAFLAAASLLADEKPGVIAEARPSAAPALKGRVTDAFTVKDIPAGAKKVRAWFEIPREEPLQEIADLKFTAPDGAKIVAEPVEGNRFLYVEIADPKSATIDVTVTFGIHRWESAPSGDKARELSADEKKTLEAKLAEFPNGETTDKIRAKSDELAKGVDDPVSKARKFYDWIIDNAEYWKKDKEHLKPSGKGSATYCMDSKTGNCTDFHALWQAMTRTQSLPTQFEMGTALKADMDGVTAFDDKHPDPSYHCWVRTYFAGRGWVYSDVSYADVDDKKKDYYFDHIDANRVAFAAGRNIDLAPKQDGPKLNWFVKAYVEVDGKEHTGWTRTLTWKSEK